MDDQNIQEKAFVDELERKYQKFEKYVKQVTYPVLADHGNNNYSLYGSCVAVSISGVNYICTASHLVEELSKSNSGVVIAIGEDIVTFDISEANHLGDDVCLIEVPAESSSSSYIQSWDMYQGGDIINESLQYLHGYPVSKNKKWDIHDHQNRQIQTGYLKIVVKVNQSLIHDLSDVTASTHFLFKYDTGIAKKKGGEAIQAKQQNMTKLVGLSGSGLWSISDINDVSSIKLAGIFVSYKHGVGAASKAKYIKSRLCKK